MPHNIDLILTITGGLAAALALGFITQKLNLSPIVGYLLAGIIVGPYTPGFVADHDIATQLAEIGIILLMFGVGLHFHLKDLLAVRKVAIPGAAVQIAVATLLGAVVTHFFGWSWPAGFVFGIAISVASTVVLTRVLADNRDLHTPSGHIAIGWLIVEDLFTILALVMLPALFISQEAAGGMGAAATLAIALGKLALLVSFALIAGQKLIPLFLGYVARTGSRELFTLSVLAIALGIAVGSAKFFGASMALGAFLGGMIVGQSEFGERAASDALPMRDAFAVLFFVSVGMLFDPSAVAEGWPLMLWTALIVLVGKPIAALAVVLLLKRPLRSAMAIAVALAQIGEFSFILAALATQLGVLPPEATNALVVASIVSITLNPMLYQGIDPAIRWLGKKGIGQRKDNEQAGLVEENGVERFRAIVVGYGPVGKTLARILQSTAFDVVIVEMNIDTVQKLRANGRSAIFGDASHREILHHAGIETAKSLIISSPSIPAHPIVQAAKELNPQIRILTASTYLGESEALLAAGAHAVFSSEGEIAWSMTAFLMREIGATDEQIDRERDRIREEFSAAKPISWEEVLQPD